MDFGLARQEAEGGGSVSGTPAYMAPEQAAGQTLDARADVYSAGVVLAEAWMTPHGAHGATIGAVIDSGSIIDVGAHDELIARCALYQRLHRKDFKLSA